MAAPAVTRPPATISYDTAHAYDKWVPLAKWAVIVVLGLFIIGIAGGIVYKITSDWRTERIRKEWDVLNAALREKVKPDDKIAALEGVVEKINGTPAHASALMQLGSLYFDKAVDPKADVKDRAAALDKATKLYQSVFTYYKEDPAFGPVALSSLATCYEQAGDDDTAIKTLKDNLTGEIEKHPLFFKMDEQLGRLYWLRSLKEAADPKTAPAAEEDRQAAYALLHVVAVTPASKEDTTATTEWRDEAKYIEALLEKPGVLLPNGVIPPEKKAEEKSAAAPAALTPVTATPMAPVTATAVAPKAAPAH